MIALKKNDSRFLIVLFCISLVLRALVYHFYLSTDNRFWQVDSKTYHLVAQGIVHNHSISLPSGQPNFYRLPGYPLLVAWAYRFFGDNPQSFLWNQVVLGACIPMLVFFLSLALFPHQRLLARCASFYSALHLGLVLYSGFFMTETVFIVFLLLFYLLFFSMLHYGRCPITSTSFRMQIFFAGLCLGLASLIRPVGHYLIFLSLFLLWSAHGGYRLKIKNVFMLLCGWFIPVFPWLLRNYMLLGHVFFHTLPGGHFLYLSASRVAMRVQNTTYQQARQNVMREVNEHMHMQEQQWGRPLNDIEKCYAHESIAKKYFMAYPLITLKTWATDIFRTLFSLYSAELLYLESGRMTINYFEKDRTLWSCIKRYLIPQTDNRLLSCIVYAEILLFILVLIGFLSGLIALCGGFLPLVDRCSWLVGLPYGALFIVIALAGGYARMRLPLEPLLIIFSCYGWGVLLKGAHGLSRLSSRR